MILYKCNVIFGGILMKKFFYGLILCTVLLGGCSAKGENGISETAVPAANSVTVTTESSAVTVSETETTVTTRTTTVTEPDEEEIILTPIPSAEPFEVMACKITNNIMINDEDKFPDKEALKLAKEVCYADEEIRKEIEENNNNAENVYYEYADAYRIKSADDIMFDCGCTFDFDLDGEEESLISLRYVQRAMGSTMSGNILIYTDGDEYKVLEKGIGDEPDAQVISSGEYVFLLTSISAGAIWYSEDIYSLKNGMPEKVTNCDDAHSISYKSGVFYINTKFMGTYPFILCEDGIFRQFGREKISRDDFEKHVENGGKYIDALAENGDAVTDIYTYGYYNYELYGEGFYCDVHYYGGFILKRYNSDGVIEEKRFTDEVVYGDVWAVQSTRSRDYDIGGGYVCYTIGEAENMILNVSKDNIITDSIKADSFDPDWQIHFYDMDVPPCFALEAEGINYRTYFVIDGKITEMNWTLDGERLDTVDYTMLHCRGEGDGFVSYSIPYWDEHYTKRHFTFADGDYTNIVGYTEDIDDKIMKPDDDSIIYALQNLAQDKNSEAAYEVMSKFFGFRGDAYNIRGCSVTDDEKLWLRLEKEGFRTKEEMLDTLSEFCTPDVAEEYYSMIVEGEYSDFNVIDGRIYVYDGAPNHYLPDYYIESAEENDGVITARFYAYYSGQDIPYRILPPLYAEFVQEDGVWKISKLPYDRTQNKTYC